MKFAHFLQLQLLIRSTKIINKENYLISFYDKDPKTPIYNSKFNLFSNLICANSLKILKITLKINTKNT